MRKLLFALLIPIMGTAQTVLPDSVYRTTKLAPYFGATYGTTAKPYDSLWGKPVTTAQMGLATPAILNQVNKATSDIATVSTQVSNLTGTVNTLNGLVTQQGVAITGLQTTINGMQVVSSPLPKAIYDNTYTLTEADNNGVIYVYVTCTVTCPTLFSGFKCKIIRVGSASSAVVNFNGPAVTTSGRVNSVYGYSRLLLQYADADINYETNTKAYLTGRISK